jgi:peptide/nickel transport system permease protein
MDAVQSTRGAWRGLGKLGAVLLRVAKGLAVLALIILLNFMLIRLAPGDPVQVMAGEAGASDAMFMAKLREQFLLDRPWYVQLGKYLLDVARFDLGYSYRQHAPVAQLIWERLPATLLLTGTAFVFAVTSGIGLGVLAGMRARSFIDKVVSGLSLLFFATPLFWLSLLMVLAFSVWLGWFPSSGMETVGASLRGWARVVDIAHHLTLPALTLGLFYMAIYARMTRASVLDVRNLDYVRTAIAKGVKPHLVVRRHILRNALPPIITLAGMQAGQLLGGAVLTETVFAWPGIGRMAFDALLQRDYMVLLGVFFMTSVMVIVFNALTDVFRGLVDPRTEAVR